MVQAYAREEGFLWEELKTREWDLEMEKKACGSVGLKGPRL